MLHAEVPPEGSFLAPAIPNRAAYGDCVLEKQAIVTREYLQFSCTRLAKQMPKSGA